MEAVFLKLLNMSIAAGWLVLAIIILRVLLRKIPKWTRCLLWALVAIRLISPFSVESVLSLIPSAETIPQDIMYVQEPTIHTGVYAINSVVNPIVSESLAPAVGDSVNPMQVIIYVASIVWIVGMLAMMVYATVSYLRIRRKVAASLWLKENMYICDYIETPFILGVLRPRIYIPSILEGEKAAYVIAHEKAHIKRHDYWWKPLGFVLLSVYWFHPIIWLAYILLCKDIELACDERVIKELGESDKKSYSEALLFCSIPRRLIVACPLAFGEVGVKERVKTVLNYKKPTLVVVAAAVVTCIVVAICFLTNPKVDQQISESVMGNYVASSCLYMNPLSSTLRVGDPGVTYQFVEDVLIIRNNHTGAEQRIMPEVWEWQAFPYTDKEWEALFVPGGFGSIENISEQYEERLYLRLSGQYSLLRMDGELWLVQTNRNPQMGEYIWSIYTLAPGGSMGGAQWEYKPLFSSQSPAFPIAFAFEDAEVMAYCTSGALVDYDNDNSEYPQGTNLTVPTSNKIYWAPRTSEDDTLQFASESEIGFYIQKDGIILYSGTIYITSSDSGIASSIYTARLIGRGMVMKQNEEVPGAVISVQEL